MADLVAIVQVDLLHDQAAEGHKEAPLDEA